MRSIKKHGVFVWLLAAVALTILPLPAQDPPPKQLEEPELSVPIGTVVPVVLSTYLNTKNTQVGDVFYADTYYPVWIQQRLVIPRGSIVKGTVTEVDKPGKIKGKGKMAVRFDSVLLPNGVERPLIAAFHGIHGPGAEKIDRRAESIEQGGTSDKGAEAGTIVGTASNGALIGVIASRGAAGAGYGAAAGAAAGVVIALLSRNRDLVLEPGVQLDLELRQPLRFAYGEIIFTQDEIDSAARVSAGRSNKPPDKRSKVPPGMRLPGIIRRF